MCAPCLRVLSHYNKDSSWDTIQMVLTIIGFHKTWIKTCIYPDSYVILINKVTLWSKGKYGICWGDSALLVYLCGPPMLFPLCLMYLWGSTWTSSRWITKSISRNLCSKDRSLHFLCLFILSRVTNHPMLVLRIYMVIRMKSPTIIYSILPGCFYD